MRPGFLILTAVVLARVPLSAQDPIVKEALPQLSKMASQFWQVAPGYIARETLKQKALVMPKRKLRVGQKAVGGPKPEMKEHEIISLYALAGFHSSPEALHEFRKVLSVDGNPAAMEGPARQRFREAIASSDDAGKHSLIEEYGKAGLEVAATDFGQLVLLFTRAKIEKYTFVAKSSGLIGADRAVVIEFHQSGGGESLRISEQGKQVREPLSGEIWVRESDYQPLRITLNAIRRDKVTEVRDEARVDYSPISGGLMLPAAVVYRRYINDDLFVENISEYTDWQLVNPK